MGRKSLFLVEFSYETRFKVEIDGSNRIKVRTFQRGFYEMPGFGPHLLLEGYNCDRTALTDLNVVFDFLNNAPDLAGMTKITQPYVFKYSGTVPSDWGVTGMVVIAESHLSLHTFPERSGFLTLDLYSCKEFEQGTILAYIQRIFKPERTKFQILQRGEEFCRELGIPSA